MDTPVDPTPLQVDQAPAAEDKEQTDSDRQIEGYHKTLHSLFQGADDIIIAQAVASFMGCLMAHSTQWRRVIPGFAHQMQQFISLAWQAQLHAEQIEQQQPEVFSGKQETRSQKH